MIISHEHKFLYLGLSKTGATLMHEYLRRHYAGRLAGWIGAEFVDISGVRPKVGSRHGSTYPVPDDYLAWATIRNPWIRLLSSWHRHVTERSRRRQPAFHEFIRLLTTYRFDGRGPGLDGTAMPRGDSDLCHSWEDRWKPQHLFYARQPATRFVRLENIQEDFAALPFSSGKDVFEVVNAGYWKNRKPLEKWYDTPALRAAEAYGIHEECEALGYSPDIKEAIAPGGQGCRTRSSRADQVRAFISKRRSTSRAFRSRRFRRR